MRPEDSAIQAIHDKVVKMIHEKSPKMKNRTFDVEVAKYNATEFDTELGMTIKAINEKGRHEGDPVDGPACCEPSLALRIRYRPSRRGRRMPRRLSGRLRL